LPGGDVPVGGLAASVARLQAQTPFLDERWARRLVRTYGSEAQDLLGDARTADDLGHRFGWDLTQAEVRWLMRRAWARTAEDVLWRRTTLGLRLSETETQTLDMWMRAERGVGDEAPRASKG
jgi:glycerol-3-phosphate dehydrogenase